MKELLSLLKRRDLCALFLTPTKNTCIQFFRYIFVGGTAFLSDAGVLWLCERYMHYLIAAAIAFTAGLTVNFALSKLIVFTSGDRNPAAEFTVYGIIGVIGLLMTELLMYIFTDKLGLYFMLSKLITTAIVLVWNFFARKIILYRG